MELKLQLALQGGGAKLMPLIAALEAVQDLEQAHRVKVTCVAGTSAGAIAGCIFAAGVPMGTARLQFQGYFKDRIEEYFPKPRLANVGQWFRLFNGRSLWSSSPLRQTITSILQTAGVATFDQLRTPAVVIATDVVNAKATAFKAISHGRTPAFIGHPVLFSGLERSAQ
jgi:predicted acylesterase/phospholipase RssA